ncbi:MAG TPA: response regulator transcription factor [Conexibacter sp.]|nr:response regulator transcription factor [Conexibacter sp.]
MLCAVTVREHEELRAGPLEVQPAAHVARAHEQVIPLTPRELDLLVALMRRPDRVLSRELLFELCWGHAMADNDRAVDVYVRKLRAKLEQALPDWRFIHTHHRLGYRFSPDETRSVL